MKRRKAFSAIIAALILSALASLPALAGGWAVLTLDELPQNLQAGQPVTISFWIRQHGITPFSGAEPLVQATQAETGQTVAFKAVELAEPGHYQAEIEFPKAGAWRWTIDGFGEHPLPDLNVQPGGAAAPAARLAPPGLWLGIGLLATLLAGVLIWLLNRRGAVRPWAWGVLAIPLLAALLLAFSAQARSPEKTAVQQAGYASQYDYGEALFVAKGCATCHANDRLPARYVAFNVAIGPDLSAHPQSAEFLRAWLKDPAAIKPETKMPTLGLSDPEIEALIAFVLPPQ